jgi:hypothetical protein
MGMPSDQSVIALGNVKTIQQCFRTRPDELNHQIDLL